MWAVALIAWAVIAVLWCWRRSGHTWWDFAYLWVPRIYSQLWHRWSTNVRMPFPREGPVLVVPSHTCSADPTFVMAGSGRVMTFLVSGKYYDLHPLCRRIMDYLRCIPVARNGRDVAAARLGLRRLQEGRAVCVFPEGNLSGISKNRFLAPRLGAAWLALKSRVPVYPVLIKGGPCTDQLLESWVFPSSKAVRVIYGSALDLSPYFERPLTRKLLEEVTYRIVEEIQALDKKSKRTGPRSAIK